MKTDQLTNRIRIVSGSLFLIACCLPVFCHDAQNNCNQLDGGNYGYSMLLMGIFGLLAGGIYLSWLANPFFFLALIFLKKKPILATVFSALAVLIGLRFLGSDEVLLNEAGNTAKIVSRKIGYWFWLASFISLVVGSIYYYFFQRKEEKLG